MQPGIIELVNGIHTLNRVKNKCVECLTAKNEESNLQICIPADSAYRPDFVCARQKAGEVRDLLQNGIRRIVNFLSYEKNSIRNG